MILSSVHQKQSFFFSFSELLLAAQCPKTQVTEATLSIVGWGHAWYFDDALVGDGAVDEEDEAEGLEEGGVGPLFAGVFVFEVIPQDEAGEPDAEGAAGFEDGAHDGGELLGDHVADHVVDEEGDGGDDVDDDEVLGVRELGPGIDDVLVPDGRRGAPAVAGGVVEGRRQEDEEDDAPDSLPADEQRGRDAPAGGHDVLF
mmetsp:Transcript_35690/g.114158  ORF Transcript_35690/g.114158 Transcript_35690/m.114158 type:complete len:200 (-) Transcript_35690:1005-1604(-)